MSSKPARSQRLTQARNATPSTYVSVEAPEALLHRLHWTVLRPLGYALGGSERSLVRGPGMELDELREYQPGDDVRHIDWNVTARTDLPFIRQARVERALDVWFLLDVSASVEWGTARCLKRDRMVEFVAILGLVLGRHGNRLGALPFAERPLRFLPPAAGRLHLLRLIDTVRGDWPAFPAQKMPAQPIPPGATDLAGALARAGTVIRRRALVLVVSDFLVPSGWQGSLRRLAQRHDVVAVQLTDPRERELPDVGLLTLEDPETGKQLIVNTSDRRLRERFRKAASSQAEQIKADLEASAVDQLVLSTSEELLPAMVRFMQTRRLRRAASPPRGVTALNG